MSEIKQMNFKAVITMALGVLSILAPPFGVVLGPIGIIFARKSLKEIAERQEEGRGLAIAGQICSILGIVISGILLLLLLLGYWRYTFQPS